MTTLQIIATVIAVLAILAVIVVVIVLWSTNDDWNAEGYGMNWSKAGVIQTSADLLGAPSFFAQIYCEARILRGWPHDAALEAADNAVELHGDAPCATVEEIHSVADEVLRTDEWEVKGNG